MNGGRGEPSDGDLVAAIAEGDRSAFDQLYARHFPWLHLRLSRRCADPGLVEEAIQDTFLTIWKKSRSYRGQGDVGAWVWGIGIRQLLNRMRRRKTPAWYLLVQSDRLVSAEDTALIAIEHGDVGGAVDHLSPELRAVVQATVIDGLTTREAARVLGVPSGTVKTRMMRARQQLREALT
ncbi:MAG: RNA polymerase sigma factor [Actinomycetota bacterium]|nr:RNA polymerase sigma factor [Actinomycetota bacterium]MDQ3640163.1 RNA polymerase sigma factor [Actinomycetota bacterium]